MTSAATRLGDILVQSRVITLQQLADALKNQVVYGGRLGTNLIELGYADYDQVALGLAKKHSVPAALSRHIAGTDTSVAALIPAELARRCLGFPIAKLRSGDQLAVCFRDPVPDAVNAIANHVGMPVVASVAAEVAVLYCLEKLYGLTRPQRYAFSSPGAQTPLAANTSSGMSAVSEDDIDIDFDDDADDAAAAVVSGFQLVDLDDTSVEKDTSFYDSGKRQVSRLLEVAESQSNLNLAEAAQRAVELASQAAAGAAATAQAAPAPPAADPHRPDPTAAPEAMLLPAALEAISTAHDRMAVAKALLGYMASKFEGALLLIVKGDIALGYAGYGGSFDSDTVESIVVPLSVPTIFQEVQQGLEIFHGPPSAEAHAVQRRFFKLFSNEQPSTVLIAPVLVKKRLVCMLYGQVAADSDISEPTLHELRTLTNATEQAFLRLIREAKKAGPG